MADVKILDVIKRLKMRTEEGKVVWQQTVDPSVFQAAFPGGYAVRLFTAPNRSINTSTDFVFQIYNDEGVLVDEVRDVDYDEGTHDLPVYRMMATLYMDARRVAMGVDKAVRSLLDDLE